MRLKIAKNWPRPPLCSLRPPKSDRLLAFQVGYQLQSALENHPCRVWTAPVDVLLAKAGARDDEIDTIVQPDVLILCDPDKIRQRGIVGTPDWILEVLSPSTAAHDLTRKLNAYEVSGVREYWLAHPTDRTLLVYHQEGKGYGRPDTMGLTGKTRLHILPEVEIDWDSITAQLLAHDHP